MFSNYKNKKYISVFFSMVFTFIVSINLFAREDKKFCETSKEFIITMEYLKDKASIFNSPSENFKIASHVSRGCEGAASRFIKTFQLLSKVGLPSHKAISYGKSLSNKTDDHTQAFHTLFKMAYLEKYLDFDIYRAEKLTQKILEMHSSNIKLAEKDFSKFVQFCVGHKELDLSRPKCADFSIEMARLSAIYDKRIFSEFEALFEFLSQKSKGPKLVTFEAFKKAIQIMKVSPVAPRNFIQAYLYLKSKDGLMYSIKDSLSLAHKLSAQTREIASVKDK